MRLIRLVAAIVFLLLGGVVGALNTQPVRLDLGVVQLDASLGVLVLVLLALGMLLGAALIAVGVGFLKPNISTIVGRHVLEVETPEPDFLEAVRQGGWQSERSGRRCIVYGRERAELVALRERFCPEYGLLRPATLEDVFLRLTGRELRE